MSSLTCHGLGDAEHCFVRLFIFAKENPVTGSRIAKDLNVVLEKVLASPESQSHIAMPKLTWLSKAVNVLVQLCAEMCAGVECRNKAAMLCSGCGIVRYCSRRCQKE